MSGKKEDLGRNARAAVPDLLLSGAVAPLAGGDLTGLVGDSHTVTLCLRSGPKRAACMAKSRPTGRNRHPHASVLAQLPHTTSFKAHVCLDVQ